MNTREKDMEKIQKDFEKGLISKAYRDRLINNLYKQSRDHVLEDKRKTMIKNMKKQDQIYRIIREEPQRLDEELQRRFAMFFGKNPNEF